MPILFALDRQHVNPNQFKLGVGPSLDGFTPLPGVRYVISGVTRDSAGVILGSCNVQLFETITDLYISDTTSDATTGAYSFTNVSPMSRQYYIVAYKAGAPDVAGTTVNTLVSA